MLVRCKLSHSDNKLETKLTVWTMHKHNKSNLKHFGNSGDIVQKQDSKDTSICWKRLPSYHYEKKQSKTAICIRIKVQVSIHAQYIPIQHVTRTGIMCWYLVRLGLVHCAGTPSNNSSESICLVIIHLCVDIQYIVY